MTDTTNLQEPPGGGVAQPGGRRWWARPRSAAVGIAVLGALLLLPALDWGVYGRSTLATDEVSPRRVDAARSLKFANGWFDYYPPVAYYVAAVADAASAPIARLLPEPLPDDGRRRNLAMRGVSVAATVATALVLLATARRTGLGVTALVAPVVWLASPTVGYYARTSNVEALYVLGLAVTIDFLERVRREARVRWLAAAAVAAAVAAATKDQAALFALAGASALLIPGRAGTGDGSPPGSASPLRRIGLGRASAMAFGALGFYAFLLGVPWNRRGVVAHFTSLREVAGLAPEFATSVSGKLDQLVTTAANLLFILGPAGALLAIGGAASLLMRRERRAQHLVHLVAAFGYAAAFWLFVPRTYERFLLPVALSVALLAAEGANTLRARLASRPKLARALVVLVLLASLARGVELALRLEYDSRDRLADTIGRLGGRPETTWVLGRNDWSPYSGVRFAAGGLAALPRRLGRDRPLHVVTNAGQLSVPGWRAAIESAGYVERARVTNPVPARLTRIGRARTNLDKLSPELVIFRRLASPVAPGG